MAHGFLQGPNGDKSNGRLIADIIILNSLAMGWVFLVSGLKYPEHVKEFLSIATAISVLYGALAGSALVSLFGHKKTETAVKPDE